MDSTTAALIWIAFAIVYQQLENHLLQPVVYGRAVRLPAFAVLLAVLVGAKLAGVVGALGAIPAASAIQIIGADMLRQRRYAPARGPTPRKGRLPGDGRAERGAELRLQVRVALELCVQRGGADRERPHAEASSSRMRATESTEPAAMIGSDVASETARTSAASSPS